MAGVGAVGAVIAIAGNVVPYISAACAAFTADAGQTANTGSTAIAALTAIAAIARILFHSRCAVCSQLIMLFSITAKGYQIASACEKKILVFASHIYTGLT